MSEVIRTSSGMCLVGQRCAVSFAVVCRSLSDSLFAAILCRKRNPSRTSTTEKATLQDADF